MTCAWDGQWVTLALFGRVLARCLAATHIVHVRSTAFLGRASGVPPPRLVLAGHGPCARRRGRAAPVQRRPAPATCNVERVL